MRHKTFLTAFVIAFLATAAVAAAQTALRVGAAKVDYTPSRPTQQLNKYDHERLYVRAIVLDNGASRAALISLEGSQNEWANTSKLVAEELNCPNENIIMSSTHTHSGATPGAGGGRAGTVRRRSRTAARAKTARATAALRSML